MTAFGGPIGHRGFELGGGRRDRLGLTASWCYGAGFSRAGAPQVEWDVPCGREAWSPPDETSRVAEGVEADARSANGAGGSEGEQPSRLGRPQEPCLQARWCLSFVRKTKRHGGGQSRPRQAALSPALEAAGAARRRLGRSARAFGEGWQRMALSPLAAALSLRYVSCACLRRSDKRFGDLAECVGSSRGPRTSLRCDRDSTSEPRSMLMSSGTTHARFGPSCRRDDGKAGLSRRAVFGWIRAPRWTLGRAFPVMLSF